MCIRDRVTNPAGRAWQGVKVEAFGRSTNTSNRQTTTYLVHESLPLKIDPNYGENFVIHNVFPGEYEIVVTIGSTAYSQRVFVQPGEVALSDIQTR